MEFLIQTKACDIGILEYALSQQFYKFFNELKSSYQSTSKLNLYYYSFLTDWDTFSSQFTETWKRETLPIQGASMQKGKLCRRLSPIVADAVENYFMKYKRQKH